MNIENYDKCSLHIGKSQNISVCEITININVGGYKKSACYSSTKRNQTLMIIFCTQNAMIPLVLNDETINNNFYTSLYAINSKTVAFVDGVKLANGKWMGYSGSQLNASLIIDDGKTKSKCNTITPKPGKARYYSNADDCSKSYGSFCEYVNISLTSKENIFSIQFFNHVILCIFEIINKNKNISRSFAASWQFLVATKFQNLAFQKKKKNFAPSARVKLNIGNFCFKCGKLISYQP
jgi:hypothetical protein